MGLCCDLFEQAVPKKCKKASLEQRAEFYLIGVNMPVNEGGATNLNHAVQSRSCN